MRRGVIVMALGCVLGCGEDGPPWQARAAEEARELSLLADVEVIRMTREEFAQQAEERTDELSDEDLQYYADTYGRLGYFDRSLDLRPVLAGSSSDWVGATYSPSNKVITLVGEARDDVFVHEWVHALQDQHFVIASYDRPETSDTFLARRAVVEGDATLAQYRFVAQHDNDSDLHAFDWQLALEARRQYSADTLRNSVYPVVFLDYVSFVYTYGLEYNAANLIGVTIDAPDAPPPPHDWGLQDELFTTRPADSTEQVLRLDVGGLGASSDPIVEVGLTSVPAGLTDRLDTLDWDRLGAWYVYLLLHPLEQSGALTNALALADGWDGDRVLFVRHRDTMEVATVWVSEWDDAATAEAVRLALWDLYGGDELSSVAADGESLWIERRDNRLVAAKNLAADVAPELVEQAFGSVAARAVPRRHLSLPEVVRRRWQSGCVHAP